MKSLHKQINLEMWDKTSDQIHYKLITYGVRYKVVKQLQVKLGFIYSISVTIFDKVSCDV